MRTKKTTRQNKTHARNVQGEASRDAIDLTTLLDMSEDAPIAKAVVRNQSRSKADLRRQVSAGRVTQRILSGQLGEARRVGSEYAVADLAEQRRLCHIATILARAELLTRPRTASLSPYKGAEASFDDATILERAKGFTRAEAEQTLSADDRASLAVANQRFESARAALLATTS